MSTLGVGTNYYGDFIPAGLDSIVKRLQNDTYLKTKIHGRAYTGHISTITNPVYPCVTIMRQGPGGDPSIANLDNAILVVDVWSKLSNDECWYIYADHNGVTNKPQGIRYLLHQQGWYADHVQIDLLIERYIADALFEQDTRTHRIMARYDMKLMARTIEPS